MFQENIHAKYHQMDASLREMMRTASHCNFYDLYLSLLGMAMRPIRSDIPLYQLPENTRHSIDVASASDPGMNDRERLTPVFVVLRMLVTPTKIVVLAVHQEGSTADRLPYILKDARS